MKAAAATPDENFGSRMKAWPDRTREFLDDVRAEMKKVNYPSRKEVQGTTTVVIICVFIFAFFFWIIDSVIQFGMNHLLKFFHA